MALEKEKDSQTRRRSKTHGWFDHGDKSLFPLQVRFAGDPKEPTARKWSIPQTLEQNFPPIRCALRVMTWILASIAVVGPAIVLGTTSLRAVQLLCQHHVLPELAGVCNNTWTKPHSVLHDIPEGRTPMTSVIDELSALIDISPSLAYLGVPIQTLTANLSGVLTDLESTLNTVQLENLRSGNIGNVAEKALLEVDTFSDKDYDFRQQTSIWDDHGIYNLHEALGNLTKTANNRNSLLQESIYHILPFLSKRSLHYNLLLHYHNFNIHHSKAVQDLVQEATETRLILQDLLDHVNQLESQLQNLAPTQTVPLTAIHSPTTSLTTMRSTTTWVINVVKFAEYRYKTMYNSLQTLSAPLAADIASYNSPWSSCGNSLPLPRLRRILEIEHRQIADLTMKAVAAEEARDAMFEQFMRDEGAVMKGRIEMAVREGRLNWL